MAFSDVTRPQSGGRLSKGRLHRLLPEILGRLAAWNDARVTRKALSRLSDRELDDIGLCRADIDRIWR